MPPKAKGKKGKKGDDDDFWATAGESAAGTSTEAQPITKGDGDDSVPAPKKAAFDGLDVDGGEDDDGDNLMAMLQKRKEKKKGKKAAPAEPDEAAAGGDDSVKESPAPAKSMTAEELADEEFGPVKEKNKKKKGKDRKAAKDDEDAETGDTPAAAEPANADASGDEDGGGPKILSKKEKEKLKKEKEKAKKKAQAAAKKTQGGAEVGDSEDKPADAPAPAPTNTVDAAGEDDDAEGGGDSAAKKKKKKKKGKKDEDDEPPAATTAAAKGKKVPAGLSALRAALEQKRLLEEETKRKEEEERRRIEEEERLAAEAARRKEEEKQRKKDKEKAKKEQARKEGRFLTDKQKKEKQQAELQRQALIKSGVIIEGLNKGEASTSAPKKVVYGKRQRGPGHAASAASVAGSSAPSTPQPAPSAALPPDDKQEPAVVEPVKKAPENAEPDWDASSGEEETKEKGETADLKDDWEASSDEEKKASAAKATPVKEKDDSKKSGKPTATATTSKQPPGIKPSTASTSQPAKPQNKPAAKSVSKATQPPESSSEEGSSSDEDEDSDEDSDDSDEDSSDEEDGLTVNKRMEAERKAAAAARRQQREADARAAASKENLRSPICCILGHVDTGKTKLLDKIRQTNVQEGEAGGITQQIGATYFPVEAIKQKTAVVNKDGSFNFKIPGLLIIDTPGHESFTNLRSRGSSLCNIAILVVDIMHGLEPQTIESLNLLKNGSTPFIIALNKIDRLYSWQATPDNGAQDSLEKQNNAVKREFETRSQKVILEIAEQGLNSQLYWKNTDPRRVVNIVPTSAITGEGVPDMIKLLVELTQTRMVNSLMYISTLECTVLEVKVVEGLGTTIDVILSNGYLREGDKIVLCGLNGPIVTQVRALLMPQPLRELRIKSAYVHNKEVKAANGVKVVAPDLDKAIAGSKLLVCGPDDDEDDLIEEVMKPLEDLLKRVSKTQTGVHVQASTLGSLEALLSFLESSKIPVSGIQIGPVHKKDVRRAMTQLEKAQEMACILCFDVPIDREAEKLADESGVKLFKADIIYHLFDAFTAYNKEITEAKRRDQAPQAVWPCRLKIIAVFAKRDPILVGVDIIEGTLRVGTPLCIVNAEKQIVKLGRIASLHINHKPMEMVKKSQAGGGVAVKIEHAVYETPKMVGRHFDENDELLSLISRQSIDVLKETFRNEVSKDEWLLIKNLKTKLQIP